MRRGSKVVLLTAIMSSMVMFMTNALAAGEFAAGEVGGNVAITSGFIPVLPTQPCQTTEYSFGSIALSGTLRDSSGNVWSGQLLTTGPAGTGPVKGGSDTLKECYDGSTGTVAGPGTDRAEFQGSSPLGSVAGKFYGRYHRRGSIVTVTLDATYRITKGAVTGPEQTATIFVYAQFTPIPLPSPQGNLYTGPGGPGATGAAFDGYWGTAGTNLN